MKKTILYSHPWEGSFNQAILDTLTNQFSNKGIPYYLIDLNKENFNPVMTKQELALFSKGEFIDPLIEKYQMMLNDTEELIVISPVWWYQFPAIVKGFFDKVMLKNFSYNDETEFIGLLTHITKATIITTGDASEEYLREESGNYFEGVFIKRVLHDNGIKHGTWLHCGDVTITSNAERHQFLEKVKKIGLEIQ